MTIAEIKRAHKGNWFSEETLAWWNCKVHNETFVSREGRVYFVTADDQWHSDLPQKFSVRCYDPAEDRISTIGDFLAYETLQRALTAARKAAEANVKP